VVARWRRFLRPLWVATLATGCLLAATGADAGAATSPLTLTQWQQAVGPGSTAVQTLLATVVHGIGTGTGTTPLPVSQVVTSGLATTQADLGTLAAGLPAGRLRTDVALVRRRAARLLDDLAGAGSPAGSTQYTWAGQFLTDAFAFSEAGAQVVDLIPPVSTAKNRSLVMRYQTVVLGVGHAADDVTMAQLAFWADKDPSTAMANVLLDSLSGLRQQATDALKLPPTGSASFRGTWQAVMGELSKGAATELAGIKALDDTTLTKGQDEVTAGGVELLALTGALHVSAA